ncbi:2Fe-2S iron-sulfur cluster-binding protein [Noviherbaspirillum sedimenti]|uniref:(2Fe-2S)-binding protein n=1 Tax=Noviherbaspirillum sedimenti TaxID=2320865 RepID=A0A3A3GK76_9BURK|nr:2Fe-2S iron-sulfur cluster-binding protein [Noviherbaspirillum sedimenti]RJG01360.1 (2Fe-2S)-binding protein [Noviherbaspirillum sedimenti]
MPVITFIEHNGTEHRVEAPVGSTAMQAAVNNGVPGVLADCGGSCSCATCHGYVDEMWTGSLSSAKADELDMLGGALDMKHNSRLTCQILLTAAMDGLIIRLPESQI